jgi:hypothetical protein
MTVKRNAGTDENSLSRSVGLLIVYEFSFLRTTRHPPFGESWAFGFPRYVTGFHYPSKRGVSVVAKVRSWPENDFVSGICFAGGVF